MRRQFLLAWPKSCIIKLCIFSLLIHSIFHTIRVPLLGPYPQLASPWAKKRLLITSSSWPKKSAWVKLWVQGLIQNQFNTTIQDLAYNYRYPNYSPKLHVISMGLTKSYESDEIDYYASNQSIGSHNFQLPQSP